MMKNMTLENIANACGGTLCAASGKEAVTVAGVVLDSRKVEKDFLFVATKGERVDGHSFIPQVVEAGAAAVVCEAAPTVEVPYILVEDSFKALRDIAAFYRRQLSVKVVGITGSVGKTSTKEVIASVLSQKFKVCKTQGNFNNEVGVPLTVFSIKDEDEIAVLEMGINHFGEMHRLAEIAMPDVCVYTNIGQCHLEFLGSRDGILKAKTEMFEHLNRDAIAVLNGDDDKLITVQEVQGKKPIFFGCGEQNDYRAVNIVPDGIFGSSFTIQTPKDSFDSFMPLPGEHMVWNAVAATAIGEYLGMNHAEIDAGIRCVQPVLGRSNLIRGEHYTLIDDCYNANPVSMKAALSLLAMADTRKVAILGDMFELGEKELELHAEVGVTAVREGIDLIICVGKLSKAMMNAALDEKAATGSASTVCYFSDRDEMMVALDSLLQEQDTILIKASHGMEFGEVVKKLQ